MIVDVVRNNLITSTGLQNIVGDLGDVAPVAAIFIISAADSNSTQVDGMQICYGMTDGTTQFSCSMASENGVTTTNTNRKFTSDECITFVSPGGGTPLNAVWSRWITNGVEIDVTDADGLWYITVVLIGGADVSAKVGIEAPPTQDVNNHVTDVGFQSDIILFSSVGTVSDTSTIHAKLSIGAATSSGQACAVWYGKDNVTTTQNSMYIGSNRAVAETSTLVLEWSIEITNIDSQGFDMFPRDGDCGCQIGYLALAFDNSSASVDVIDTPISTGNDSQTIGIEPNFVMLLMTYLTGVDSAEGASTSGALGISTFTADDEFCIGLCDADNVSTSNTSSLTDAVAVNFDDEDGDDIFDATFVSMDATGFTLNYSATDGSARKWVSIALEAGSTETVFPTFQDVITTGFPPTALKGPDAVETVLGNVTITSYPVTTAVIGEVSPVTSDHVITGFSPTIGSDATVVVKAKTKQLIFSSTPVTLTTVGLWGKLPDASPQLWSKLPDQCRS